MKYNYSTLISFSHPVLIFVSSFIAYYSLMLLSLPSARVLEIPVTLTTTKKSLLESQVQKSLRKNLLISSEPVIVGPPLTFLSCLTYHYCTTNDTIHSVPSYSSTCCITLYCTSHLHNVQCYNNYYYYYLLAHVSLC